MSDLVITTLNTINNISLQIGDKAYAVSAPTNVEGQQTASSEAIPKKIGTIVAIGTNSITISESSVNYEPAADEFLMFSKDKAANNTSLIGYYAEVKLANDSSTKAELFALSSEIAESSK